MSLLPFLRNFIGVEGDNAAAGVVKALVQLDPDSATIADLRTMEQDLDNAGRMIAKLRADLAHEQAEFDSIGDQYHADNATVRSVFVIGPDKKVKAMLAYPMTSGRNFDEVLRLLGSCQLTAQHQVATP